MQWNPFTPKDPPNAGPQPSESPVPATPGDASRSGAEPIKAGAETEGITPSQWEAMTSEEREAEMYRFVNEHDQTPGWDPADLKEYSLHDPADEDPPVPDLTSLSVPSFPQFPEPRRGLVAVEDVQTWYHDVVVPKVLEILEQSKIIQSQRQREQQRLQDLQDLVDRLGDDNKNLHKVVEEIAAPDSAIFTAIVDSDDSPSVYMLLEQARTEANVLVADAEAKSALIREKAEMEAQAIQAQVRKEAQAQLGELYHVWRDVQTARAALGPLLDTSVTAMEAALPSLRTAHAALQPSARPPASEDASEPSEPSDALPDSPPSASS